MRQRTQEKLLKTSLFIVTLVMIIIRFLLNEKGRITPDSVRFLRSSHNFPLIDNTTTPLGYPLSIKLFTLIGVDEFWSSKLVGILAYILMVLFAWKKRFYFREVLLIGGLFSYVSLFAATLSEGLFLPFVFIFIYISRNIIIERWNASQSILYLSLILILIYNIRFSGLFLIGGCFLYGLYKFNKKNGKIFLISSLIGLLFIVLYKLIYIDYFNENYVKDYLQIGLYPTYKLLIELIQGLITSLNPFIHISNPNVSIINFGIYGIGIANLLLILFLFIKLSLSETEKFIISMGIIGIVCSFFIQYFYKTDPLDYRLLSGFNFFIWLIYFKKNYQIFGNKIYIITFVSLISGFIFSWLSKGNYLENRKITKEFLIKEDLLDKKILFYKNDETDTRNAEIISTINPNLEFITNPKDTIDNNVLTNFRLENKMKINKNKFR